MAGTVRWLCLSWLGALLVTPLAIAQTAGSPTATQSTSQTVTDVLHQMSDRAGVVFMGQVLAVRLPSAGGGDSGVAEVDFRVDQAIRGCTAGTTYALREWGGLWVGGSQRYRVGQRLLMLLHTPSAAGLSSPVDGLDGAIPIRQGSIVTPLAASSNAGALPFVDLRWLGAKVQRPVSYRTAPLPASGRDRVAMNIAPKVSALVASGSRSIVAPMIVPLGNASPSDASVAAQEASVDAVLGMLTTWQKAANVAP